MVEKIVGMIWYVGGINYVYVLLLFFFKSFCVVEEIVICEKVVEYFCDIVVEMLLVCDVVGYLI